MKSNQSKRKEDPICDYEQHFILRLPEDIATNLREDLTKNPNILKDNFTIKIDDDMRNGQLRYNFEQLNGKLVDLPCIVDVLKTNSSSLFYKSGSICQMFVCSRDLPDRKTTPKKMNGPIEHNKEYLWSHGICPPFKNVRRRRFRKTLRKKYVEMPEVETEVKRLLRADCEAKHVSWEIVKDETFVGHKEVQQESTNQLEENIFGEEISSEEEDVPVQEVMVNLEQSTAEMNIKEEVMDEIVVTPEILAAYEKMKDDAVVISAEIKELKNACDGASDLLKERFLSQIKEKQTLAVIKYNEINGMREKWGITLK